MRRAEVISLHSAPRRNSKPKPWVLWFAERIDLQPEARASFAAGVAIGNALVRRREPLVQHLPATRRQIVRQILRDVLNLTRAAWARRFG